MVRLRSGRVTAEGASALEAENQNQRDSPKKEHRPKQLLEPVACSPQESSKLQSVASPACSPNKQELFSENEKLTLRKGNGITSATDESSNSPKGYASTSFALLLVKLLRYMAFIVVVVGVFLRLGSIEVE